jgi:putative PEP-CTERM system histidine kinase
LLGLASFLLAALAYLVLGGLILVKGTSTRTGRLFVVAIMLQVAWASSFASAYTFYAAPNWLLSTTEAIRTFAWTLFLLSFGQESNTNPAKVTKSEGSTWLKGVSKGTQLATFVAAALCSATIALDFAQTTGIAIGTANLGVKIIAAVLGLWCIEQLYRNTATSLRWAIKFLCIALLALFGYDMVMYTEALLFERVNYAWMTARGIANAVLVPLLAISAVRNRGWKVDITVSRTIVFHSTTLVGAGIFLIVMSTVGYYVRYFGGQWGAIAQALVVFTGFIVLLVVFLSGQIRARIRVFVAKNFFSYRYDYRDEWLALTRAIGEPRTIAGTRDSHPLPLRALLALGRFVESHEGAIWLANKSGSFTVAGVLPIEDSGKTAMQQSIAAADPFLQFMREKEWIIVLAEMRRRADLYGDLKIPSVITEDPLNWLLVPLLMGDDLIGFVTLKQPTAPMEIDWEVRDILKTAARQTASYLMVERAVEELVVSRQFESFNKMSAFVVHDLKNLVAQLQLLLGNATKHRHNPEFQDDMLSTVENVMERMQGLLLQLRAGTKPIEQAQAMTVKSIILEAVESKKSSRIQPNIVFEGEAETAQIKAHADRLARVVGHLVQNANEACAGDGKISIKVKVVGNELALSVQDNGDGMTEQFLRTQLFKPFSSNKAHGMGIGTFESKEYIGELGGSLEVQSVVRGSHGIDHGTTFTIKLPIFKVSSQQ